MFTHATTSSFSSSFPNVRTGLNAARADDFKMENLHTVRVR